MEDIDGIAGTTTSHLAGLTLIGGGIQDAEVTKLASALYSNSITFTICLLNYILSYSSERKLWYSSVLFRVVPCTSTVRTHSYPSMPLGLGLAGLQEFICRRHRPPADPFIPILIG